MKPATDRIEALLAAPDDKFDPMCERLIADIPALLNETGASDEDVKAWQDSLAALAVNGLAAGKGGK